jgi:hypothetical protein
MAILKTLQVTLGAGATQVFTPGVLAPSIFARQVQIQNNAAANVRVGDANVSATRGALLLAASNGSVNYGENTTGGEIDLSTIWLFGTATQVIDVIYIQA